MVCGIEQALIVSVRGHSVIAKELVQINGTAVSGVFSGRRRHFACGSSRCIAEWLALTLVQLHFVFIIVVTVVVAPDGRHIENWFREKTFPFNFYEELSLSFEQSEMWIRTT
jgi:hypothetical protein